MNRKGTSLALEYIVEYLLLLFTYIISMRMYFDVRQMPVTQGKYKCASHALIIKMCSLGRIGYCTE